MNRPGNPRRPILRVSWARVADLPKGSRRRGTLARDTHDSAVSSQNPMAPWSWCATRKTISAAWRAAGAQRQCVAQRRRVAGLDAPQGVLRQFLQSDPLDLPVGELELHALERRQRLAELLPLEHVVARELERAVEHAQQRPAGKDEAEAHVVGSLVVQGLELERGSRRHRDAGEACRHAVRRRCDGRRGRPPTQRRGSPATAAAGASGFTTSSPSASTSRGTAEPLRHRVRHRPVPRAPAQRRGGLGLVRARPGIEVPSAEFGQDRARRARRAAPARPRPAGPAGHHLQTRAPFGPSARTRWPPRSVR